MHAVIKAQVADVLQALLAFAKRLDEYKTVHGEKAVKISSELGRIRLAIDKFSRDNSEKNPYLRGELTDAAKAKQKEETQKSIEASKKYNEEQEKKKYKEPNQPPKPKITNDTVFQNN